MDKIVRAMTSCTQTYVKGEDMGMMERGTCSIFCKVLKFCTAWYSPSWLASPRNMATERRLRTAGRLGEWRKRACVCCDVLSQTPSQKRPRLKEVCSRIVTISVIILKFRQLCPSLFVCFYSCHSLLVLLLLLLLLLFLVLFLLPLLLICF